MIGWWRMHCKIWFFWTAQPFCAQVLFRDFCIKSILSYFCSHSNFQIQCDPTFFLGNIGWALELQDFWKVSPLQAIHVNLSLSTWVEFWLKVAQCEDGMVAQGLILYFTTLDHNIIEFWLWMQCKPTLSIAYSFVVGGIPKSRIHKHIDWKFYEEKLANQQGESNSTSVEEWWDKAFVRMIN